MGLPVSRTIVLTYVLSGFCAALGGAVFTLYTSSGNAVSGTGLELDAIAAVVIGGTLLSGGYGSVLGTLLGVLILGVVQTAITFQGTLSSWWSRIVVGILLLVFMLVQKGVETAAHRAAKA
jgi:simple sugar transport system permease protein